MKINRGFYFTGPKGYYLPGTAQCDILGSLSTTLQLSQTPQQGLPIFVGNYTLDSQGFYEKNVEYRYKTAAAVASDNQVPPRPAHIKFRARGREPAPDRRWAFGYQEEWL